MKTSGLHKSIPLKHIRMGPTRFGWLFVAVVAAMLLGSINYNNNLGFLVTFLLGSMALISLIHSYRNLSGFHVRSMAVSPIFAGQPVLVQLEIDCGKTARRGLFCRFGNGGVVRVNTESGMIVQANIPVLAEKRGRYSTGALKIHTVYPLGLFFCKGSCDLDLTYMVYPSPGAFQHLTVEDLLQAHSSEGDTDGQVDDFKGLRHFQTGDAIGHIFWKAFAKGQGLMVKEFAGGSMPSLFLTWDRIKGGDTEDRLSRLCAMVVKAEKLDLVYGLKLPGNVVPPDTGRFQRHECLRALALF